MPIVPPPSRGGVYQAAGKSEIVFDSIQVSNAQHRTLAPARLAITARRALIMALMLRAACITPPVTRLARKLVLTRTNTSLLEPHPHLPTTYPKGAECAPVAMLMKSVPYVPNTEKFSSEKLVSALVPATHASTSDL